jgi:hypothetical protein
MSNAIFKRSEVKDWNPTKYKADCCGSIIWSTYPGCFKSCECGKSFVDQTAEYVRLSGNLKEYTGEIIK